MEEQHFDLRKKRAFHINTCLERELGNEYSFDGIYILKNGEKLINCSTWEKMIITKIYNETLESLSRVHYVR
jgi:hypothetical protein